MRINWIAVYDWAISLFILVVLAAVVYGVGWTVWHGLAGFGRFVLDLVAAVKS